MSPKNIICAKCGRMISASETNRHECKPEEVDQYAIQRQVKRKKKHIEGEKPGKTDPHLQSEIDNKELPYLEVKQRFEQWDTKNNRKNTIELAIVFAIFFLLICIYLLFVKKA
jgi:hypothetical protein